MVTSLAPIPTASLQYDAPSRWLSGRIGARRFGLVAESGGGRGSTHVAKWQSSLRSHLATTREVKDAKGKTVQRGGTLPAGLYLCRFVRAHWKYHDCVQLFRDTPDGTRILTPLASHPIAHGRDDDFFIHGRGDLGSDGCLVPLVPAERIALTCAIRDFAGLVVLLVKGVGYALPAERFDGLAA